MSEGGMTNDSSSVEAVRAHLKKKQLAASKQKAFCSLPAFLAVEQPASA